MVETALLNWTLQQILSVVIILTRVGTIIFLMPVMGSRSVPAPVKALLSLVTALTLAPVVNADPSLLPTSGLAFTLFIIYEVGFGAILSLFARFIFAGVETAGQMVGIQMGMGMAGVMDPQFGEQVSIVGSFWGIIAILIFLGVNGHHIFFKTLVESFTWVAPGNFQLSQATFDGMMQGASHMFVLAVKIMAPASAAVFFSHVAMGVIAKTVPQIPILIVGMPMNIAIGFIFVGLSLGYLMPLLITNFDMLGRLLPKLAMGMGG
ncbi:MAG: flagellar biosynthetic protein FliR [Proteobacteria bacterium]|nr:flagellar biosynthetic protein FliR [Pseudomonadota bacterium]MBU1708880.1 flagellar biosynthetic protein FliR [Pseudomonadota bacterium]